MAVTSKPPQRAFSEATPLNDEQLKQLIHKGGTPPSKESPIQSSESTEELKKVQLRLPQETLDQIDQILEKRNSLVRPSRHTWLLEAIAEKLEREGETTLL